LANSNLKRQIHPSDIRTASDEFLCQMAAGRGHSLVRADIEIEDNVSEPVLPCDSI
jgi:hypothetical protein